MQVFFGAFRGRGFPASASARPSSAEQPDEPVQASSELAALVAQSLEERQQQGEAVTDPVSREVHLQGTIPEAIAGSAEAGTDAAPPQRPDSALSSQSAAAKCQAAAAESPVASSPQP